MADNWLQAILYADLADGLCHGAAVSNMAYLIAGKLGLSKQECYDLAVAGMVHDVGKLRLCNYLYGRNSNAMLIEEMQYMRMHSQLGYEILRNAGYSDFILEAVLYHHENYDGTGYPENLRGDAIPIGARILRVCDYYCAMISERPYRAAFDFETAISNMIEDINEFDMKVFLAFMDIAHDDEYADIVRKPLKATDFNLEEVL